jgi:plasmid stabilization system protein ParE
MKVRFTAVALSEYDAVLDYIRSRSPGGARSVQRRLDKVISDLERFPYIGTMIVQPANVRMLVATPYPFLVYYRVNEADGEVVILDVRHGARERNE